MRLYGITFPACREALKNDKVLVSLSFSLLVFLPLCLFDSQSLSFKELDLDKRAMELVVEEFQGIQCAGATRRVAEKHCRDKGRECRDEARDIQRERQAQACRGEGSQALPA